MELHVFTTKDQSNSVYHPLLKEPYHSIHGALTESLHVYIKNGLNILLEQGKTEIDVFELGFGTGLNAFLSFAQVKGNVKVNYHTIELFPLSTEVFEQTNYKQLLKEMISETDINAIFQAPWEAITDISSNFSIHKLKADILTYPLNEKFYDIIYFDAFAPNKQPELWTQELFLKMYQSLKPNGSLVTYCARGYIKRDMKAVGFQLQKLNGPPGKREMTKGIKKLL